MCKFTLVGLACGLLLIPETAKAQFVRVGPGGGVSVRAPFVHVEVGPGGSTYVRAPFTSVVTPGFGRVVPSYEYQGAPVTRGRTSSQLRPLTAEEFATNNAAVSRTLTTDPSRMNWRELRHHTRTVAGRFEDELRRSSDGATWATSLRPGTIRDLLAQDVDQPPDSATVNQLSIILQSYEALAESQGYPQITGLSGFREMRQALRQLTLPPHERMRQRLSDQWNVLHQDLGQFETGATWQNFLELPTDFTEPVDSISGMVEDSAEQESQLLQETLSRYEQLPGVEKYRAIVELESFQQMRRLLAEFRNQLHDNPPNVQPESSSPETIPPPQPLP